MMSLPLPPLAPGTARAERVRALCRARLERDRRRSRRLAAISRPLRITAQTLAGNSRILYSLLVGGTTP